MSDEKKKKEYKGKPAWLSKTNWSVVVAIISMVLGYFGVSTEWLTSLASGLGVEPIALSATFIAILNIVLKAATWAYYKWIKKDDEEEAD